MKKIKQLAILIFAIAILVGGIYFVIKNTGSEKQKEGVVDKKLTAEQEQKRNEMLGRRVLTDAEKTTLDVLGDIGAIDEKTITVKKLSGENVTVDVSGDVSITITNGKNQTVLAKLAELMVGDAIRVTYDKTTKAVKSVSVLRPDMPKF